MQIFNAKPTFFDAYGDRLVGGRVAIYAYETTILAEIYSDPEFRYPIANPIPLTSGAWWSPQPFCKESVSCHVQEYVGEDEYAQPIYNTVLVFNDISPTATSGGETGSIAVVDTIAALRGLTPVNGAVVAVKGYYVADDSYVREYIFNAVSAAIDDGGVVVSSTVTPVGRWLLRLEGDSLDVRAYGVIADIGDVNSQLRAAQGWATANGWVLHIPKGTYKLAAGGTFDCYAALDIASGVKFGRGVTPDAGNLYVWSLYNTRSVIRDTFASTNVKIVIQGDGWGETTIPITAWDSTAKGYASGTGSPNILLNQGITPIVFDADCVLGDLILAEGVHTIDPAGHSVQFRELRGNGVLKYISSVAAFRKIRTSLLNSHVPQQMQATSEFIALDTAVTLPAGFVTSAYCWAESAGSVTTTGITGFNGGLGGNKKAWILGTSGIDCGITPIDATLWANGTGLINSFNASDNNYLDLQGWVTTAIVTKSGTIRNGTIGGVTASSITMDHVTVNGQVTSTSITATHSTIKYSSGNAIPNVTSMNLTDCHLGSLSTAYMPVAGASLTDVTVTGHLISTGGNVRCRGLTVSGGFWIVPNSSLYVSAIDLDGISVAGTLVFDASIGASSGESKVYSTYIRGYVGNLASVNGATKLWAVNGHSNVRIETNRGATRGTGEATIQMDGGHTLNSYGRALNDRIFVFRTDNYLQCASVHAMNQFSADVFAGGTVIDSPRAISLTWYGQTGTFVGPGVKINLAWNIYPEG